MNSEHYFWHLIWFDNFFLRHFDPFSIVLKLKSTELQHNRFLKIENNEPGINTIILENLFRNILPELSRALGWHPITWPANQTTPVRPPTNSSVTESSSAGSGVAYPTLARPTLQLLAAGIPAAKPVISSPRPTNQWFICLTHKLHHTIDTHSQTPNHHSSRTPPRVSDKCILLR